MNKKRPLLPLSDALFWIIGSIFLITGPCYLGFKQIIKKKYAYAYDREHVISFIVQTGPQKGALHTDCLAEILRLSVDDPQSSLFFNPEEAAQRLRSFPVILDANVKIVRPDTIYVDYTLRQPVAWLEDFENTVMDIEGCPFPFAPFFSPKNLPAIYFGLPSFGGLSTDSDLPKPQWGVPLQGKYFALAKHLLSLVTESSMMMRVSIKRIDVSHAYAKSYGQREIVLLIEDRIESEGGQYLFPQLLRLSTKNYAKELGNYLTLRDHLLNVAVQQLPPPSGSAPTRLKEKVIDLRLSHLAFIN